DAAAGRRKRRMGPVLLRAQTRETSRRALVLTLTKVLPVPEQPTHLVQRQPRETRGRVHHELLTARALLLGQHAHVRLGQHAVGAGAVTEASSGTVQAAPDALEMDALLAAGAVGERLPRHDRLLGVTLRPSGRARHGPIGWPSPRRGAARGSPPLHQRLPAGSPP